MSRTLLKQYDDERKSLVDQITSITEGASLDERDISDAEMELVERANTRIEAIDRQMQPLIRSEELRNAGASLDVLQARATARQQRETATLQVSERVPSLGDFVDSDAYRNWSGNGKSSLFTIEQRASSLRATLTEGAAPGSTLLPHPPKYVLPQGDRETPLLDAISRLMVSTNSIDLVTYGVPAGATGAAEVAEAAKKPEAALTTTATTVNVPTVAYWLKATRQLLQDAPAARGFIDDQLRRGLVTKMETDAGAAIGGATYTKTTGATKQTLLEVARIGVATVAAAGFRPNAILCSPTDAAAFDLALYTKTFNGAAMGINPWGLQVIPVNGLTKAYVGDFKAGVTLVERTGINIYISDSNEDDFLKNVFTILAEYRAKTVVTQPAAITELVVTP